MKYFVLLLSMVTYIVQAQNIKVVNIEQLTSIKDGDFVISAVSPTGDKVYISGPGYKGLFSIDVKQKSIRKITGNAGAGYEPVISENGLKLYFRSDEFVGVKKYTSLSEYDLTSGKTSLIKSRSRDMTSPVIINNQLIFSVAGKRNIKQINKGISKGNSNEVYVVLEDLTPVLYINGTRKPFTPNGPGNYIWVSLSPDKTRLLYNFKGTGTFISNLDGTVLDDIGRLNAPRWLNNQVIIGMDDKDDGHRILSSDIIAYSVLIKKRINLTSTPDRIEMYPFPFPDGIRIVYQTIAGELYIMNLSNK
jgi:hypothetical protein